MTNILQRYRELRSMGQCESRAKVSAAIEHARNSNLSVDQATKVLTAALAAAKDVATRPGGQL